MFYPTGMIAIDDITFSNCTTAGSGTGGGGNCEFEEFSCTAGGCVAQEQVCDFENQCSDASDEGSCPAYQ